MAHTLLGLSEPAAYGLSSEFMDKITAASAAKATVFDVFLTLCAMEQDLSRNAWRDAQQFEKDYLATLIEWGYDASDVERKVLDPELLEDVLAAHFEGHEAGFDHLGDRGAEDDSGDIADEPEAAETA